MYARVEKAKTEYPESNYALAQTHLTGIQGAAGAKVAGQ
jgi:hypothetical protein